MESTLTFLADYGTDLWFPALVTAAIAYFCGCFNGAVIVSKYILRDDVRNHGSGNAGLTNFYRTFGGPLTFLVILCDVLKAVVAIKMAVWLTGQLLPLGSMEVHRAANALSEYWGGLFCLLGHMFPCMFHFKGGKGILSGGTIRWKCYRAEDYPTPEAVARRCAAGLVTIKPENKPHEGEEGHLRGDIRPVHDSPLRVRWECWGRL